ncbi:hypothetical protein [Streptomyces sp. NPDC059262]|uniref:hypothetical protein n=1 Tax=Streptomyces sp. NPDC059262 TaxID=3346797 RepID=UPI0036A3A39C
MAPPNLALASKPVPFLAAAAALKTMNEAVHGAQNSQSPRAGAEQVSSDEALAALLMLRELREQLTVWEPGLIETARVAGTSWADRVRTDEN